MPSWFPWLIALSSTTLCLFLWFRDVRRIMTSRKSTVESAAGQLAVCRRKAADAQSGSAEVLKRSESIYRQAVDLYNAALHKPWICLPAALMGFRPIENQKDGGGAAW